MSMPILQDNTGSDPKKEFVIVSQPVCYHCERDLRFKAYLLVEVATGKAFCDPNCIKEYRIKEVTSKL